MPDFKMKEIITFYDGIQLAFMRNSKKRSHTYLVAHSVDDGVYLASRVSAVQVKLLYCGKVDVKTVMKLPFNGEMYIVIDPLLLPTSQQNRMSLDEYCSIPVEYDPIFDQWAIPNDGLFITDLQ